MDLFDQEEAIFFHASKRNHVTQEKNGKRLFSKLASKNKVFALKLSKSFVESEPDLFTCLIDSLDYSQLPLKEYQEIIKASQELLDLQPNLFDYFVQTFKQEFESEIYSPFEENLIYPIQPNTNTTSTPPSTTTNTISTAIRQFVLSALGTEDQDIINILSSTNNSNNSNKNNNKSTLNPAMKELAEKEDTYSDIHTLENSSQGDELDSVSRSDFTFTEFNQKLFNPKQEIFESIVKKMDSAVDIHDLKVFAPRLRPEPFEFQDSIKTSVIKAPYSLGNFVTELTKVKQEIQVLDPKKNPQFTVIDLSGTDLSDLPIFQIPTPCQPQAICLTSENTQKSNPQNTQQSIDKKKKKKKKKKQVIDQDDIEMDTFKNSFEPVTEPTTASTFSFAKSNTVVIPPGHTFWSADPKLFKKMDSTSFNLMTTQTESKGFFSIPPLEKKNAQFDFLDDIFKVGKKKNKKPSKQKKKAKKNKVSGDIELGEKKVLVEDERLSECEESILDPAHLENFQVVEEDEVEIVSEVEEPLIVPDLVLKTKDIEQPIVLETKKPAHAPVVILKNKEVHAVDVKELNQGFTKTRGMVSTFITDPREVPVKHVSTVKQVLPDIYNGAITISDSSECSEEEVMDWVRPDKFFRESLLKVSFANISEVDRLNQSRFFSVMYEATNICQGQSLDESWVILKD